ncbi:MAG: tyrosine-type recombinase/integrase [Proteobacteria bacterium]|nr:tyrosine-type recombinase/integrase [Pseudomonadota bacterium]
MQLDRVANREKLKPRREPYWDRVAIGQHLGFRPSAVGGTGTWVAKAYDADTRKKHYHALGEYAHLPPNERHKAALKDARNWFDHIDGGGSHTSLTVRQACEQYANAIAQKKGEYNAEEVRRRFNQYVFHDSIARVPLQKLTDKQMRAWRERLEALPVVVRRKNGTSTTRKRASDTVNRDMVPFRAALNLALERGDVLTNRAWHSALKPAEPSGARRNIYLDRDQRRALIEKLPQDVAAFVRGLCALPLRPGALAALTVGDFDHRRRELVIGKDKAGRDRRILLPESTAAALKVQAKDKLPAAYLFTRADGAPWKKDLWKDLIKAAVIAAELPAGATAYTMRHSTITDLVTGGLDLLTIAQVSGTSVAMIEKHYGHLRREHAAKALAALAL